MKIKVARGFHEVKFQGIKAAVRKSEMPAILEEAAPNLAECLTTAPQPL